MKRSNELKREFKFSVLRSADSYFSGGGSDKILLQGIVDCFFIEGDEIVVLDFKSDKVSNENVREKAQRYTPQLDVYADALERITGKRVKEKIIYFFAIDLAFLVD